jgi:hypothetical protein
MAGAVLCPLSTRHDSAMVSTLLGHLETKIIFADYQFLHIAQRAIDDSIPNKHQTAPSDHFNSRV